MKKLLRFTAYLSLLLFASGCKKDAEKDATLSYSLSAINMSASLSATTSASGLPVTAGTNGSINWTSASFNISNASFSANRAGTAITLESKNINLVNALKPDSLSGKINITAGVYEAIKLKLLMTESPTLAPFILNGTYTELSGTKIPVIVQINRSQLAEFEIQRFEVATSGQYVAKVVFEMNGLVKGLTAGDFGQTVRTGSNNTILVSSTINKPLWDKLVSRLSTSVSVSFTKL